MDRGIYARVWTKRHVVRWRMYVVDGDRCMDLRKPLDGWCDIDELDEQPGEWLFVHADDRRAPEQYGSKAL